MLTLFDYLPSQNAWKVRQLLQHLQRPYRSHFISIFEGEGQTPAFRAINPAGAVPALQLADGRVLAESNAILLYLAHGSDYLPQEPYALALVQQWLSFEGDTVQNSVATLRHWVQTGKDARRPPELVQAKRQASLKVLGILDQQLSLRPYIAGDGYSVADIALYAYVHRADEAGLPLQPYRHLAQWFARVREQPGHLAQVHPYAIDPHSAGELP